MPTLKGFINGMSDGEFREKVRENLFAEIEPFLPFLPEEYSEQLKKTKFSEVRSFLEKECKAKAKIIAEEKRWDFLEQGFERLKKKV